MKNTNTNSKGVFLVFAMPVSLLFVAGMMDILFSAFFNDIRSTKYLQTAKNDVKAFHHNVNKIADKNVTVYNYNANRYELSSDKKISNTPHTSTNKQPRTFRPKKSHINHKPYRKLEPVSQNIGQNIEVHTLHASFDNVLDRAEIFYADQDGGIIGTYSKNIPDDPQDNLFLIRIPQMPKTSQVAVLRYEVNGLEGQNAVAYSINGRPMQGGIVGSYSKQWTAHEEYLLPDEIHQGLNTILFASPAQTTRPYAVRNLSIAFIDKKYVDLKSNIVRIYTSRFNGNIYFRGIVSNPEKFDTVKVGSMNFPIIMGVFEGKADVTTSNNFYFYKNGQLIYSQDIVTNENLESPSFMHSDFQDNKWVYIHLGEVQNVQLDGINIHFDKIEKSNTSLAVLSLQGEDMVSPATGVINVTHGNGYRIWTPDGQDVAMHIALKYDESKIPSGFRAQNIVPFYFDKQNKQWQPIKPDTIDQNEHVILFKAQKSTDYINGIIKNPESPQSTAFTPTMMNDIKAANPLAGIQLMSPPQASQTGEARLTYPLKIPSGRRGMQPSLTLQYNSNGGNGWLGLGWNIPISEISLDTRWGVPRFDPEKETEIYTLDGQQLMYPKQLYNNEYYDYMPQRPLMVPDNNGELQPITTPDSRQNRNTTGTKIFTLRKQNKLIRIERFGNNSTNYYWKVTLDDGTINWYGAKEGGIDIDKYTIKNENGQIVNWALAQTIDVFGNTINYKYYNITINSSMFNLIDINKLNLFGGKFFAIKEINYTGYNNAPGDYKVIFKYDGIIDRNNIEITRNDIQIYFRRTVKEVIPFLLEKVSIYYKNEKIREYSFHYSSASYSNKKLLSSLEEVDMEGNVISKNEFQYYNNKLTYDEQNVRIDISSNWVDFLRDVFPGNPFSNKTDLSTTFDFGGKFKASLGFELYKKTKSKPRNISVNFGVGLDWLRNQGKVTMLDMNGDGLKDIVYYTHNTLYFIPHEIESNGTHVFRLDDKISSFGLKNFFKSKGERSNYNFELSVDFYVVKGMVSLGYVKTKNETRIYITDGNGDGLPDIVKADDRGKAVVYFNYLDANGQPHFTTSSRPTENVICTGEEHIAQPDPEFEEDDEINDNLFDLPKYDVVRVWVAPKTGDIEISGHIEYFDTSSVGPDDINYFSIETATPFDGPTTTINTEQFSNFTLFPLRDPYFIEIYRLDQNNTSYNFVLSSDRNGNTIHVERGQMIFFRLHSNDNASNKHINSNISINYIDTSVSNQTYSYSSAFVLDDKSPFDISNDINNIKISWPSTYHHSYMPLTGTFKVEYKITLQKLDVHDPNNPQFETYIIFNKVFDNSNIIDPLTSDQGANSGWLINNSNLPGDLDFNYTSDGIQIINHNTSDQISYSLSFTVRALKLVGNQYVNADSGEEEFWRINNWEPLLEISYNNGDLINYYKVVDHNFFKRPMPSSFGNGNLKFSNFLGPLQMGWGQFLYAQNWEHRLNSNLIDPSTGLKPIDHQLIYNFQNPNFLEQVLNDVTGLNGNSSIDDYTETFQNILNGMENNPDDVQDLFDQGSLSNLLALFICSPLLPKYESHPELFYKYIWHAPFSEEQYTSPTQMKNSLFFSNMEVVASNIDNNLQQSAPTQSFDSNFGMYATFLKSKNRSKDINVGGEVSSGGNLGETIHWTKVTHGGNDSFTFKHFFDLNGDSYPDIVESKGNLSDGGVAMLTNMLGGHNANIDWKNAVTYNNREYSGHSAYLNVQAVGANAADKLTNNNTSVKSHVKTTMNPDGNPAGKVLSSSIGGSGNYNTTIYDTNYDTSFWADVNGDGLPDWVYKEGESYLVKFNNGISNTFMEQAAGVPFANLESATQYNLFPSISLSANGAVSYDYLTYVTEYDIVRRDRGVGFNLARGASKQFSTNNIRFIDFNNDGLLDILYTQPQNGSISYKLRLNLGNRFSDVPINLYFNNYFNNLRRMQKYDAVTTASIFGNIIGYKTLTRFTIPIINIIVFVKGGLGLSGSMNYSVSTGRLNFFDFDGDGYTDILHDAYNNNLTFYSIKNAYKYHKLIKVKNIVVNDNNQDVVLNSFSIDYDKTTPSYDDPTSRVVMKRVTVTDNVQLETNPQGGNDADGVDTYVVEYDYKNPRYDRRERLFFGFGKVLTKKGYLDGNNDFVSTVITTNEYHNQNFVLHGMLKKTETKIVSSNTIVSLTQNKYELRKVDHEGFVRDNIVLNNIDEFDKGGFYGFQQAAVILSETFTDVNEENNPTGKFLRKKQVYITDEYGRVIKTIISDHIINAMGTTDNGIITNSVISQISYHNSSDLLDKNILSVPKELKVFDAHNTLLKRKSTIVDGFGSIIGIKDYFDSQNAYNTTYTYDDWGNLKEVSYPNGMFYKYSYQEHKLINKIEDAFNYESYTEYDLKFDVPLVQIDIAGNKTTYEYDNAGRLISVTGPKEQNTGHHTIDFEYYPENSILFLLNTYLPRPLAITKHYDPQHPSNPIETYTFADGLGRIVQIKKDIEIDGVEKMTASGAKIFDKFGRVIKQYHPTVEDKDFNINKFPRFNNLNGTQNFTQTVYDELNRPITFINEEAIETHIEYGLQTINNGSTPYLYKKTITPQNNNINLESIIYKDVNDRIIRTAIINENGDEINTDFKYDVIGQLIEYTDHQGISTSYKYDLLGRKISIISNDYGETKYKYDNTTGNLASMQTANLIAQNKFIEYRYDRGRPTDVIFPEMPYGDNIANVHYEYGNSGNETGRIVKQTDATGTLYFKYGNMGEVTRMDREIIVPNGEMYNLSMEFEYDSWNRIQKIVYPDGEKVTYAYDLGGNLKRVSGFVGGNSYDYISNIKYDHYEQKIEQQYGNGTKTTYTYSPTLRRLVHYGVTNSNNDAYLDNEYRYDYVGNITSISNHAGPYTNHLLGMYSHSYTYDRLNRLVKAEGFFDGDQHIGSPYDYRANYELEMQYTGTGDILLKKQTHSRNGSIFRNNTYKNTYEYQNHTHRVSKINNENGLFRAYEYDRNGNIVYIADHQRESERKLYWDEVNRLRVVYDDRTGMQHYFYDAHGERILKADTKYERVYENGSLTERRVTVLGYTVYPFPQVVLDGKVFTKHYFAGTMRFATQVSPEPADRFLASASRPLSKRQRKDALHYARKAGLNLVWAKTSTKKPKARPNGQRPAPQVYFYHPDHLGTATLLTDIYGNPYQLFLNLPFGEEMAAQHAGGAYATRYKFNGKELDPQTGYYYYGARYYDPVISRWLSVDPLAEKYPGFSAYNYTLNNPVRMFDPNGKGPEDIIFYLIGDNGKKREIGRIITDKFEEEFTFREKDIPFDIPNDIHIEEKLDDNLKVPELILSNPQAFALNITVEFTDGLGLHGVLSFVGFVDGIHRKDCAVTFTLGGTIGVENGVGGSISIFSPLYKDLSLKDIGGFQYGGQISFFELSFSGFVGVDSPFFMGDPAHMKYLGFTAGATYNTKLLPKRRIWPYLLSKFSRLKRLLIPTGSIFLDYTWILYKKELHPSIENNNEE